MQDDVMGRFLMEKCGGWYYVGYGKFAVQCFITPSGVFVVLLECGRSDVLRFDELFLLNVPSQTIHVLLLW